MLVIDYLTVDISLYFLFVLYTIVNINSKYKEDDCTNSNASVNSLDVCVHMIHFRNETHHTCQIPAHPSSRLTPAVRVKQLRW